jgi:hypothetical protein
MNCNLVTVLEPCKSLKLLVICIWMIYDDAKALNERPVPTVAGRRRREHKVRSNPWTSYDVTVKCGNSRGKGGTRYVIR